MHAGEKVIVRQTEASKLFEVGDSVLFSAQDFNDISMTLLRFCEALTAQLEEFGKSRGVTFTTPTDGTATKDVEPAEVQVGSAREEAERRTDDGELS